MFTRKLITVFLLIGSVSGNNLRIEDGVQVEDNAEAVPDEIEIDASAEDASLRNLYYYKKYKDDDDCDEDCDCDDVIKAFENFFDCCVEEDRRRLHGYHGYKHYKHCGYDEDFSDDVNYAIKCCDFDDLVEALE
mmetsp:Transcript_6782/g.13333  ORF Transcript_6782/g.13333 Transcript_6782/m.13333 type:complete len:134 (-) Transcript_6782:143-544(-)|eukprot:CAMPEP_0171353852 /NCGR_PEP_ID=MMETSP0878-20121228/44405_1 /TAXON_ID=67004 /ORGANISM="Thalassiosira weissflogii, Strain CCMP1336" /LENGTH=133 /DNA_ID=CAMNT_0011859809 /DNA_START=345 /DNA_END=746 /DNA_ORIENTATION=+